MPSSQPVVRHFQYAVFSCTSRALWLLAVVAFVLATARVSAQNRPLMTEDPESIGAGRLLLEGGIDFGVDQRFPASGLEGDLLRVPVVGIIIGLSSIAELQIDGSLFTRLAVSRRTPGPLAHLIDFTGDSTSDIDDFTVATKVRFLAERPRRPGMAVHLATKLPTAGNESGLGLDTIDFFATLALGKTVESTRVALNIGAGILSDPVRGSRQNDVLIYGISVARAMSGVTDLVGEIHGRASFREKAPPPGTESRAATRFGVRFTHNPLRLDAGLIVGLTPRDPNIGVTAGLTYVVNAFRVP